MNTLPEGTDQLERTLTREPIVGPAAGSLALHGLIAGSIVFYALFAGFFHHNDWGGSGGGAIQVQLVSDAIPLPQDEKPNENVLATETPSQAPAPPQPKVEEKKVDTTAIPIPGKQEKIKQPTPPKTQQHQPPPKEDNRARFGEQASTTMPRSVTPSQSSGPTMIGNGDFGSRFGWYVDGITRKMSQNWYKQEVDPATPRGARVFIIFTIHRDGSPSDAQLDRTSGSPTLDRSCIRGAQRVDTFGNLPAAYNQSTLKVSYYCEY
jgi:protein TonB